MPDPKGDKLFVRTGSAEARRRLKGFGHGVRKVHSAGKNQAVIIHTATGRHLQELESKFSDVGFSNTELEVELMPRVSAGLLMYRIHEGNLQVLLVHPGGPFFKNKDDGAWSIPKGEVETDEDLLECAKREFSEEIGVSPTGPFIPLKPVKQKGGKIVHAWAVEGNFDPSAIVSNTFTMEWPPRSGRQREFPEIDRAEFFDVAVAKMKINAGQAAMIEEL